MNSDSSLDRFLRNRAAVGLGLVDKRVYSIQGLMGGVFTGIAVAMMSMPLLGGPVDAAKGSIGILFAGSALLLSSMILKRRYQHTNTADFKLSPEAKGLLLKLVRRRLGWFDGGSCFMSMGTGMPMMGKHTRRTLRHIAWDSGDMSFGLMGGNRGDVSPTVLELLDVAAEQYNRIQGILQTPSSASSTLAKLSTSAMAAADEAMSDILHDCAALDKFPESANATRKQIENAVHSLRELGDRLEQLAMRDQSITDKVDYASRIDSVLEELRLEQLARSELQSQPGDNEQKLRG